MPDPPLSLFEVINGLEEPLERRGFERRHARMAEAPAGDHWVTSWLRMPPPGQGIRSHTPDSVVLWAGGYLRMGLEGLDFTAKLDWGTSSLGPDEFAVVVCGLIDNFDRFVVHTGPLVHGTGFRRGT